MKPEWSNLRLSTRARVCKPATARSRRDGPDRAVRMGCGEADTVTDDPFGLMGAMASCGVCG